VLRGGFNLSENMIEKGIYLSDSYSSGRAPDEKGLRVVFCNYRYFVSGGPERYMFSLGEVLESHGHSIIPFSVAYKQNLPTPYSKYFVSPPGADDQVYFKDLNLSLSRRLKFAMNSIYSLEARKKMAALIKSERPDIIQNFQINTYLSYSILDACYKYRVPVVSRMSTFQLMCPGELFFREDSVCEACKQSLLNAIRYRCVQDSYAATTVRVLTMALYDIMNIYKKISAFIVPSRFLQIKMKEYGFPGSKVFHVPSFVNVDRFVPEYRNKGYIVYFGRIVREKGVLDLVKAYEKLNPKNSLKIIGDYHSREGKRIRDYVNKKNIRGIEFYDFMPLEQLQSVIQHSMFTVCPSIWYENTPLSVYESLAWGKPVIGARIGSIPEQIEDGKTGLLYEKGNPDDLAEKMHFLLTHSNRLPDMGAEARQSVEERYSPEVHYEKLIRIYSRVRETVRG